MKILVLWADDESANLGVRVLADGAAALARRAWGDSVVVEHQDFGSTALGTTLTPRVVAKDIGRKRGAIKTGLRTFDVVLDTGAGDSFTDIYGLKRFGVMTYVQWATRRVRVPLVLVPQTIGPFNRLPAKWVARRTLRIASIVMSRDNVSEKYSAELGRPVDVAATDLVFALPVPPRSDQLDVIFNVSGLLWQPGPHVDSASYQATVRGLLNGLLDAGRKVTLLAHVLDNRSLDNDMVAINELTDEYGDKVNVIIPDGLEHARTVLASGRVVLGSRMHACLNALSVGTPAVPLAYSRKFAPLLSDLGWEHTFDLRSNAQLVEPILALVLADDWGGRVDDVRDRANVSLNNAVDALRAIT